MRRSSDFASVVRSGARSRSASIVVHQHTDPARSAPMVGFVIGRSVGGSVVRHRVARRLRAQVAQRLATLPAGSATVVRALPGAATATSAQLGAGLDQALRRLVEAR